MKFYWKNKKTGNIYKYMHEATHSETSESMIVYVNEHGDIFVRPYELFFEKFEPFSQ